MTATTRTMTRSNNVNRRIFEENHDDNVFPPTVATISPTVISCGTVRDLGNLSLSGVNGSGTTGRAKMLNPICRIPSLRKENMSHGQLSKFCFLPSDILPPPHHLCNSDYNRQHFTSPPVVHTSFNNVALLHQPKSRIGRESQRYALSPITNLLTTRLTVGSVPILRNGKILMVSSGRKASWILPKGGWEEDESCEDGALRETYEEGGILGTLGQRLETVEFLRLEGGVTEIVEIESVKMSVSGDSGRVMKGEEDESSSMDGRLPKVARNERRRRMLMYPLYVQEIRETWPESGRARKAVDIDTAIETSAGHPEFQAVLREVKRKGYHHYHPSMKGIGGRIGDSELR